MAGRGSKSGARHIAPLVRGSFVQAIEQLKAAGTITGMADIWMDIIANDPARALELLAKYVPKEMLIEIDDARPFAFMGAPLTVKEWAEQHAPPELLEHDDEHRTTQ
jgi:hypothetical protein